MAYITNTHLAGPTSNPIDLTKHLSKITISRNESKLKGFYKYFAIPGIGNLAGGLPNHNYFPFDTFEASTALPTRFLPTPSDPVHPPSDRKDGTKLAVDVSASRILVPKVSKNENVLRKIDLESALQYGTAQGYPPLYSFVRQFTRENMHPNVPYEGGPEIILTCGSTDGFSKSIEALSNAWSEGDPIALREGLLVEEFAYMGAIQTARPRGMNIVPVAIDEEGMCAEGVGALSDVLENWDTSKGKRPHLLYTVTIGQNPTTGTLGMARRKAIYELCVKYDVLIIEDDPYWYLQYPSANPNTQAKGLIPISNTSSLAYLQNQSSVSYSDANTFHKHTITPLLNSSGYPFLDSLVPSYLSVDYEGRVIRLDTFSKTVAPGCRLGWITAQPALRERLLRITETSTQQPSGFVQSIIAELIMGPQNRKGKGSGQDNQGWQTDGWVRWLEGLRGNYERRMNLMCNILEEGKELVKTGRRKSLKSTDAEGEDDEEWSVVSKRRVYDFVRPQGGMFIWVQLNFPTHPLYRKIPDHAKFAKALFVHLTRPDYLVLISPAEVFAASEQIREEKAWQYFRICFGAVDDEVLEGISRKLVKGIHDFWKLKKVEDIDDMIEDEVESEGSLVALTGFGC